MPEHPPSLPVFLVVEDDLPSRQFLVFMLKRLHIVSLEAADAEQALELVRERVVDGMLLDIALGPGMSGLELMQKFRKQECYRDTPLIAITASWRELLDTLIPLGFTNYIEKPYTFEVLKNMLARYFPLD